MRVRRHAGVLAACALFAATPSLACSMMRGYRVPTNLELAAAADTIVVADVYGERKGEAQEGARGGTVLALPTLLLKGARLPREVELQGASLNTDPRMVVASAPRELREPNPGALLGGCVRYTFAPGSKLVLFLKRDTAGKFVPYRSAFSRDAEDVSGDDALWIKAVREYAAISALPRSRWHQRLRTRIAELRAVPGDADAAAIAADMAVELSMRRLPSTD